MSISPLPQHERIIWEGHPSWADHAVLFIFMGIASLRTVLAMRSSEWLTAGMYLVAIGMFLGIAALFHYFQFYQISSERIRIISGLRTKKSREIFLDQILSVQVRREILNGWFDLGSLEIVPNDKGQGQNSFPILKGIPDPDRLKRQLDFLTGLAGG